MQLMFIALLTCKNESRKNEASKNHIPTYYLGISITWGTRHSYYIALYLMVHGFHNDFTRHNIPIDLEVRVFEVRGLSKVHLAAVLKALLYEFCSFCSPLMTPWCFFDLPQIFCACALIEWIVLRWFWCKLDKDYRGLLIWNKSCKIRDKRRTLSKKQWRSLKLKTCSKLFLYKNENTFFKACMQ